MKKYIDKKTVEYNHKGINYNVTGFRINNDVNGNPRWVIHFMDLNLNDYDFKDRLQYGLKLYKAKWFGGGYVIQSYNFKDSIIRIIEDLNN